MAENKLITLGLLKTYDGALKEYIQGLLDSTNGDVTAVQALVDTLIGTATDEEGNLVDAGKSVRAIALEELAKQLVPENAKEALDTLQEIAAWIQQHPEDVATMNAAIAANAKAVEDEAKRADDAEKELANRLDTIEGEGAGSIKKAQADAATDATNKVNALGITAVNYSSETGANGEHTAAGKPIEVVLGGTVQAPTATVNITYADAAEVIAIANGTYKEEGNIPEAGDQEMTPQA